MPFTALPAISDSVAVHQRNLSKSFAELNFTPAQSSGITAIISLGQLFNSETPEQRQLLRTYFKELGYLPDAPNSYITRAIKDGQKINGTLDRLVGDLVRGKISADELAQKDFKEIKRAYPELNKAQIKLLQTMVKQQLDLDRLDVAAVESQFPLPVTQGNYFGRFLAAGCDTPDIGMRFLSHSTAFFVRMRSLIEGLSNDSKCYLHTDIISQSEVDARVEAGNKGAPGLGIGKLQNAIDILHTVINNSRDFFGTSGERAETFKPLRCIVVPQLPNPNIGHVPRKEHPALAHALYDWLFFGKKSSPYLTMKALSTEREDHYARLKAELANVKIKLNNHLATEPPAKPAIAFRKWEGKEKAIHRRIDTLEKNIEDHDTERAEVRPILSQLEESASIMSAIRTFRSEIARAQAKGEKIVFSFFGERASQGGESILRLWDTAYNSKAAGESPGRNLIRTCSLLFTDEVNKSFQAGRSSGFQSILNTHTRRFTVNVDEINACTHQVLLPILPRKENSNTFEILKTIVNEFQIAGVHDERDLRYVVREATGKTEPSNNDFIDYAFEHGSNLGQEQLMRLFDVMRAANIPELPERSTQLAIGRYRHSPEMLSLFTQYCNSYHPNKIGDAPSIFTDLANFSSHLKSSVDALGMAPEIALVEKHLKEDGVVVIVDGTNYHPELDVEIGATGDKLGKGDAEKTEEVWGDYIRPSERLIRALSLRLTEGKIDPALRDYSLMGVVKPDKVDKVLQKVIRKIYGLDIDITHDLSTINKVLADLTMYDKKTVLVIDGDAIKDFAEYEKFLDLLKKFEIKVIIRTREAPPGKIPRVNVQPFLEKSIPDRLILEGDSLQKKLRLEQPVSREIIQFTAERVKSLRQPGADPLNLTLQMLHGAATNARYYPDRIITEQDVVAAIPPIFHLPAGDEMRLKVEAIGDFVEFGPDIVLGQRSPIAKIGRRMKNHLLLLRDPTRPLTILLPGPTGVGKTELMLYLAQTCDIPFFMIEGAEYSEPHTVSRLVGSPVGYVGNDEGILYKFLKENKVGIIFIDEIEKMHPDVYQALMNFFDKATVTAGNGKSVTRPGFIIVGASNAGADKLTRDMPMRKVKEILATSFTDRNGRARPELVGRFEPIPMLAIEEPDFKSMLEKSLHSIGARPGFINANLRLVGVDDIAMKMLYDSSKAVCAMNEASLKIGFGPKDLASLPPAPLYNDLRHVSRAIDELAGDSLQDFAVRQYESANYTRRNSPLYVRMVGDIATGSILLAEVAA